MPKLSRNALAYNIKSVLAAKLTDGKERPIAGVKGLWLSINADGTARYIYRGRENGKQIRPILGIRGAGGINELADVRRRALDITNRLAQGLPALASAEPIGITLRALFERRMADDSKLTANGRKNYRIALTNKSGPNGEKKRDCKAGEARSLLDLIGDLPADSITKEQAAEALRHVQRRSRHLAQTAKSALDGAYSWGAGQALVSTKPTAGLDFEAGTPPKNCVLSPDELGRLWVTPLPAKFTETTRILLKLLMILPLREGELAGVERSEIDFVTNTLTIQASRTVGGVAVYSRMKDRSRPHALPLSTQAVALLKRALELSGTQYAFPARSQGSRKAASPHVRPDSVSTAATALIRAAEIENATGHDFRRTIATFLRATESEDVVRRALHHAGAIGAEVYFSKPVDDRLRGAMQSWADHVERCAAGIKPA